MAEQDKSAKQNDWTAAERESLRSLFRMAAYFFMVVMITAVAAAVISLILQG